MHSLKRLCTLLAQKGEIADHICYLAICKYKNDASVYLFGCNADYEVVSDLNWQSIDECMRVAKASFDTTISWIAKM